MAMSNYVSLEDKQEKEHNKRITAITAIIYKQL